MSPLQAPAHVKPILFFNSTRADRPASFAVTTGGTVETVIPMLSLASVSPWLMHDPKDTPSELPSNCIAHQALVYVRILTQ